MNKEKLLMLIEKELVQAEAASNEAAFNKHMYAIHTLTALYADETSDSHYNAKPIGMSQPPVTSYTNQSAQTQVSAAEIKAMGGKVSSDTPSSSNPPGSANKMVTDDQFGNGDSIFDF